MVESSVPVGGWPTLSRRLYCEVAPPLSRPLLVRHGGVVRTRQPARVFHPGALKGRAFRPAVPSRESGGFSRRGMGLNRMSSCGPNLPFAIFNSRFSYPVPPRQAAPEFPGTHPPPLFGNLSSYPRAVSATANGVPMTERRTAVGVGAGEICAVNIRRDIQCRQQIFSGSRNCGRCTAPARENWWSLTTCRSAS